MQNLDCKTKGFCDNGIEDIKTLREQIRIRKLDFSEIGKENINLKEKIDDMDYEMKNLKILLLKRIEIFLKVN